MTISLSLLTGLDCHCFSVSVCMWPSDCTGVTPPVTQRQLGLTRASITTLSAGEAAIENGWTDSACFFTTNIYIFSISTLFIPPPPTTFTLSGSWHLHKPAPSRRWAKNVRSNSLNGPCVAALQGFVQEDEEDGGGEVEGRWLTYGGSRLLWPSPGWPHHTLP